ncbi:hypothetical protein BDY19DRAFT_619778 [Irpex rosettiformis]|uniref:Uncharacterized protein n=1 Tax=Irpex rosettiformis TaxID=378272 RepID=A0ACB8TNQ6_9APHY|nr:hypothetical protein BDY19DRAFT_619778 [Irpex rosettiformis]
MFAAIRTCALWNKNFKVFACVLAPGLLYPIGYTYYATRVVRSASRPPITGCTHHSILPPQLTPKVGADYLFCTLFFLSSSVILILRTITDMLGASTSMMFELVTVVLTWMKTVPIIRELRPSYQSTTRSLSQVIFYDGTLQFIALILANTIGLLGFLRQLISFAFSDLIQKSHQWMDKAYLPFR